LRALSDALVQLAGLCHVVQKNPNRLHAHGSACTLVAVTQDVALDRAVTGIGNAYPWSSLWTHCLRESLCFVRWSSLLSRNCGRLI